MDICIRMKIHVYKCTERDIHVYMNIYIYTCARWYRGISKQTSEKGAGLRYEEGLTLQWITSFQRSGHLMLCQCIHTDFPCLKAHFLSWHRWKSWRCIHACHGSLPWWGTKHLKRQVDLGLQHVPIRGSHAGSMIQDNHRSQLGVPHIWDLPLVLGFRC